MNDIESLSTIAQVSMALTGFAGLLTAFRRRQSGWSAIEIFAIRDLLVASVCACLFALLPMPLLESGLSAETVWAICLPILGLSLLLLIAWSQRERFRAQIRPRRPIIYWGLTALGLATSLLLVSAIFGGPESASPAYYLLGLGWLLLIAMVQFLLQILESLAATDKR